MLRLTRSLDEALAAARRSTHEAADLAWEERVWRLAVSTPDEESPPRSVSSGGWTF